MSRTGSVRALRLPRALMRVYRHYVPTSVFVMVAVDICIIALAVGSADRLGYWTGFGPLWPKGIIAGGLTLLAVYLADLYRLDCRMGRAELTSRVLLAVGAAGMTTAALGFAMPTLGFGRMTFVHVF